PVRFAPGEKYEYSNTGYVLLASIAEKAAGKDFIALSRERIFVPLGMTDTDIRTVPERRQHPRLAKGHIYVKERQLHLPADSFPSSNYTLWLGNRKGPGRISSTLQDLLKWDQALYSNRLVSAATLAEAFSPMHLNDGSLSPYGFGWDLEAHPVLGRIVRHNGDNPGYKTQIIRCLDTRQTIIILCNNAFDKFDVFVREILNTVAYAYRQKRGDKL
ncbi:MAG TPA: serine hydrolase domain-containing protein, partial [Lacibacter sp.]|nr:serine hydrolase domain-containing protein [Lacibacter sp.]